MLPRHVRPGDQGPLRPAAQGGEAGSQEEIEDVNLLIPVQSLLSVKLLLGKFWLLLAVLSVVVWE